MRFIRFLLAVLAMFAFLSVEGKKHIPLSKELTRDRINILLKELDKNKFSERTLSITDSIITLGKQVKWAEPVAKAYEFQSRYYWQTLKAEQAPFLRKKIKEMMDFCDRNKFTNSYFFCWNSLISFFSIRYLYDEAFLELQEFEKETIRRKSEKYQARAHQSLGNIYYLQKRTKRASQEYLKAAELFENIQSWISAYDAYFMAASNFRENRNYEMALGSLKKAEELMVYTPKERELFEAEMGNLSGICYYHLNKYDKVLELNKRVQNFKGNYYDKYTKNLHLEFQAYVCLIKKQYEQVLLYADSIIYTNPKYSLQEQVYLSTNKYKEATEAKSNYFKYLYITFNKGVESYGKLEKTLVDIDRIDHAAKHLSLENKQLELKEELARQYRKNAILERESLLQEIKSRDAKSKLENAKTLRNREKEKKQAIQKEFDLTQKINQTQQYTYLSLDLILIILAILSLVILNRRSAFVKQLKKDKEEMERASQEAETHLAIAQKAREEAEDADQIKSQYIQDVSREIRIPLTAIVGFSNLLTQKDGDACENDRKEYTQIIEDSSKKLSSIVNDILDLANLTTGKYKMQYVQVPVKDLISRLCSDTQPLLSKETVLESEISDECKDLLIYTDFSRVLQAVDGLLNNAAKFTSKGFVRINCEKACIDGEEEIQITVSDTGIGVPADKAEAIFERSCKINEFSASNGFGLKISRAIAFRLHGTCTINMDYHPGAQFRFTFPLLSNNPDEEGGLT